MMLRVCYRSTGLVCFLAVCITIGKAKRCYIGTVKNQDGCIRWSLRNGNFGDCVDILPGGYRTEVLKAEIDNSESFATPVFKATYSAKYPSNELDECQIEGSYPCSSHAKCIDTVGSFRCECKTGFTGDGLYCSDIDECELNTIDTVCNRGTVCINTEGSYRCECLEGFYSISHSDGVASDELFCKDIDECGFAAPNTVCNTGTVCINTEGSYRCECMEGFSRYYDSYDGTYTELFCQDIDECNINAQDIVCGTGTVCINTEGSYRCDCLEGFVNVFDPGSGEYYCQDIDECEQSSHGCSDYADCINFDGSFECLCKDGFYGDGFECFDTNECSITNLNDCSPQAVCVNTDGSYQCLCKAGYTGNGTHCVDTDECQLGLHNCIANNTVCKNTPSSFECVCLDGFVWNGSICIDVDECQLQIHNCSANNTNCQNLPGSFACPCSDGFVWNGSVCVQIDECTVDFYPCDATSNSDCVNTIGSYQCYCFDAFNKSGKLCKDIDECILQTHNCPDNTDCKNTLGGYQCDCRDGFTNYGLLCHDIDECAIGYHYCTEYNGQCRNTIGSFECHCLDGFNGTWPYCAECPGEWSYSFNLTGDTYCVVSIKMTWVDANSFCNSFGAHLAEIQDLERNTQLANIIQTLQISSAWIGLRDIGGNWVFESGTSPTFFNWNAGEPNYMFYSFPFEENCASLHDNTYWSSGNCLDIQMESICVKKSYDQPGPMQT